MSEPITETFYAWYAPFEEDDGSIRWIIPWGDRHRYKHPFDYLFKTAKEAREMKRDLASHERDWRLFKVTKTLEPIE